MGHPKLLPAALAALLALSACAHRTPPRQSRIERCDVNLCVITQATWTNHINPSHCQGNCQHDGRSKFEPTYCGSLQDAIGFCRTLMKHKSCIGVTQDDGNIAYTAIWKRKEVGFDRRDNCHRTKKGTVIYDPVAKRVVTQFPGFP